MRNLKRALSLTLASVMLLGMMVVGAGAAGYPDVDSNDNAEAIEVLQAVKVMVGDDNGNFGPDDQVNRAQMAVVMALLLDLNYDYYEGADPGFWDVPSWAAPYVAACYANGIVSGYGNGQYGSADSVTAVQAASMMMRALGYFKYQSDYKEGFELSTVSQASKLRLFDGIAAKSNEPLTRNDVAQLALNTLKTPIVEPDDNTISITDANGNVVATGGQVNYVVTASRQPFAKAIDDTETSGTGLNQVNGYIVELGEQLYNGKLELRNNGLDDFGRPARTWVYNGTEIGSYAKKELLVPGGTYTVSVKGKTIYELLGQTAIRDNTLYTYLDGARNTKIVKDNLVRSYDADLYGTGRGVLTEVYLDNDRDELYIVSINTWLAKASVDYNTKSESITLTVYNGSNGSSVSKRVDVEDAPFITNMKKDDWCLVQWNGDVLDGSADKVVSEAFDVEIREDQKVTAFKRAQEYSGNINENDGKRVTEITTGGETYSNNAQAWYKNNTLNDFDSSALVNKTYTVFMDQYGYFIGVELYSGKDQYVFITGYDVKGSNISNNTATAAAIFTDGTMQAIDVNVKDTNSNITAWNKKSHTGTPVGYAEWKGGLNNGNNQEEMWYKYTENRGVYTLTPVDGYTKDINETGKEREVDSSKVYLSYQNTVGKFGTGNSHGEDASIYITVNNGTVDNMAAGDDPITDVTGVYTGAQDVNLIVPQNNWIHAVWKDNYIVAAIVYGEAEGSVNNYAYIRSGINKEWIENTENGDVHYWEFDAVMDGETVTKTIKSKFSSTVNELKPEQVQELILDNDGYVTKIKDVAYIGNICDNLTENDIASGKLTKLYDNLKFRDSYVNGTDTLKGKDVYHVETSLDNGKYDKNGNYYLYNGGRQGYEVGVGTQNAEMPTLISGTNYTNMNFQGNTLHYNAAGNDLGLPVDRNAKAAVSQIINNKTVWENYDSVASAFNVLNDANDDSTDGKQFDGEIIAVLDSRGVAAWVVFIDNTPTSGRNDSYGDSSYDYKNQYGIKFRVHNGGETGRDVDGRVDRYGDLFIYVPVSTKRAAPADITVEVNVNGRHVGYATYMNTSGGYHEYKFADRGLDVNTDDILVIVTREKDTTVDPEPDNKTVRVTLEKTDASIPDDIVKIDGLSGNGVANKGAELTLTYDMDTCRIEVTVGGTAVKVQNGSKITASGDVVVKVVDTYNLIMRVGDGNGGFSYIVNYKGETVFMTQAQWDALRGIESSAASAGIAVQSLFTARAATGFESNVMKMVLGGVNVYGVKDPETGYFVLNLADVDLEGIETEKDENGEDYVRVSDMDLAADPFTGDATITRDESGKVQSVYLDLGTPVVEGAKLPDIITVKDETGEAVNAEIVWKNEAGEVVEVAGSDDLSKYTYTLEIVAADETVEFTPNVVVTTKDGEKAFTVPSEALTDTNTTVSVDETGTITAEKENGEEIEVKPADPEKPVEPAKKWIITVDGPKEGVEVTGADNLDAVPDGTVITVTPVEGYTVKIGEEELTAAKKITVTDNVTIYVVKNPEKAKFELTLTVYDGDKAPVVAADGKVVTGTKGESKMDEGGKTFTPWTYEITEGASVRVRGSVELNEGNYEIGEDKIPVKVVTVGGEKEATFNMPASAFALDLTVDESEMNVVYEITINGDMEASWKMEDTDEATPLSKGTNTVPEGAKITITAVKDGQGILVDKTAYKATGAAGENKEDVLKTIYDETPVTIEVKNAPIALYSAVKVVNETSVDAAAGDVTIEKTSEQREDGESEAVYWVAAGQEVTLNAETGKSYFTNADKGKETSKVSPWSGTSLTKASGQVKFTVSGNETIHILEGYKVTASEGITLTLESGVTESKTTETLPNVVYVKKGTEVSVKSASGTKVTKLNGVTEFACMSDESDKVVSGGKVTVNDGDITLNLAYQVTFGEGVEEAYWATGELTAEGKGNVLFPKPEPKAENNTKVAYALKGAWIMAQGETVEPKVTGAVENSAKKVGVKSTVFQVGETAVSVLISDAEATNETSKETGTFESVLANAVDGDVITLNKEVKLESRITLDKNITLNLNGHEIDGSTVARAIDVKGNVKIKDGAVIGKTSENDLGTIYVYDNATLNLENVNVTGMGCIFVGTYYSSVTTSGVQTATLNITGGTLTTSAKSFSDFAAISTGGNQQNGTHIITAEGTTIIGGGVEALYLPGVADVTLTDCTVTGANGISIKSGELNLKGTTSVTGTSENGSITDSNLNNNGSNETGAAISIFGQTTTYKGHITVNIDKTVTLKGNAKENGKTYEIVIAGTGKTGESWSGPQLWIDGDRVTGGEANGWNIRQLKTGNSGNGNSGSNGSTGTESGGESEG